MIDLYYWPTPNGHKISIMLEECGFGFNTIPVDIRAGAQIAPIFSELVPTTIYRWESVPVIH